MKQMADMMEGKEGEKENKGKREKREGPTKRDQEIARAVRDHAVMILDESDDEAWKASGRGKPWAARAEAVAGMMRTAEGASNLSARLMGIASEEPGVGKAKTIGSSTMENDSKLLKIIAEEGGFTIRERERKICPTGCPTVSKRHREAVIGYDRVQMEFDGGLDSAVDAVAKASGVAKEDLTAEGPVPMGVSPLREKAMFLGRSVWVHVPVFQAYVIRLGKRLDKAKAMGYDDGRAEGGW